MTGRVVELDYAPRVQFLPFHNRAQRWACMVCHRRAGKTLACVNDQIKRAITLKRPNGRFGFIAPFRGQAKEVAWAYLKHFSQPLWGADPSESDLRVTLLNNSTVRLFGGDNPDAIRGGYFDDVIMDEFGDQRPSLWRDVVRPMLADRHGSATFIGTPKGKNEFWEISQTAKGDPANYYHLILPASQSGILPQSELDAMLLAMGTDRYMQELECSFEAAIHGAFYAEELRIAQEDNRIRGIQVERAVRVHTAWDLGVADSTAIWFIQCVGTERRLIDYYEASGVGLDHYVEVLENKKRSVKNPNGYLYGTHYFPHDIAVRELTSGRSRRETLEELGVEVTVVPQHNVLDGINATRRMLDHAFVDPERAFRGLECLRNYRREYDERLKIWKTNPLHDWSCVTADTLVFTSDGLRHISNLPYSGKVMTPCGWRRFYNPRITRRNAPLVAVTFDDGLTVRCTAEHLFLTENGWKFARDLRMGLLIQSSLTPRRNISAASSIAFGRAKTISRVGVGAFTSMFGKRSTANVRQIATSIMRTMFPLITGLQISNACPRANISLSHGSARGTGGQAASVRRREKKRRSGIAPKLVANGTVSMRSAPRGGPNGNTRNAGARFAASFLIVSSEAARIVRSTARTFASIRHTIAASLRSEKWWSNEVAATSVERASPCPTPANGSVGSIAPKFARRPLRIKSVLPLSQPEDVWCLSVQDSAHWWTLANGAVTHNSHGADALRQFAVGHDEPLPERREDRHRRNYDLPQTAWGV